ncbi:MAG TPA: NUDIX domain-containing protein [Thermoflexia bacterium]|nr:NUDIX domain-containing protein [Thermoflexia bacterium]
MDQGGGRTWDGRPVSPEPPYGATVVVYRRGVGGVEFLVLHRAHEGVGYEGEWAWTPPSGARYPGEPIEECAARELREETGLTLPLERTGYGDERWYVYMAEAEPGDEVRLGEEHDRCEWVGAEEAIRRCLPEQVSAPLRSVARDLEVDGC